MVWCCYEQVVVESQYEEEFVVYSFPRMLAQVASTKFRFKGMLRC